MNKKVLITGSSGMLGSNLIFELKDKYDISGIYKSFPNPELKNQFKLDLTKYDEMGRVISKIRPDYVVHCAALANVDICEENYELARATNAFVVKNLLSVFGPKVRFIYISTDSLFDGKKGNYNEMDLPSPLNNYAKTKLEGEWFVEQMSDNYVIIRPNIFGWNHVRGRLSIAEWVLDNLSRNKPIKMFNDFMHSPVTANTLCFFIDKLLNMDFTGRLNIGSVNSMSKYDFGIIFTNVFGLNSSLIESVSMDTFKFKAKRPKNMSLDVSKATAIFGSMPEAEDEIEISYNKKKAIDEKNKNW